MIRLRLEGTRAIDKALRKLPRALENSIRRKAARAAAKPVLALARVLVPKKSGALGKAIRIRSYRNRKTKAVGVQVAVGKKWFRGDEFYAGFVHFGTRFQTPNPFLDHALERNRSRVRGIMVEEIRRIMPIEIARAKAKGKL